MSQNKVSCKKYCSELTFAFIEIGAKASVVMLNFLYGRGKIHDLPFIVVVCLVQLLGSALFIKSALYDRSKITRKLEDIQQKFKKKEGGKEDNSDSNDNTNSICNQESRIFVLILLQACYTLGSSITPWLYKQGKLDLTYYILISICSFCVGIIPTVVVRRVQKLEDEFLCDKILEISPQENTPHPNA